MGFLDNTSKTGSGRPLEQTCGDAWDAIEANAGGTPADGSVTNAKLATDVKVGSLASLTTTEKSSVVGSINELDTDKYEKPGTGIPSTDMSSAVQTSLGLADTSLQGSADITAIRAATITLTGATNGVTNIAFQTDTAATVTSTNAETYDLTSVGDGGTIIANVDGNGNETATVNFAAGYSYSGATPSTDISAGPDDSFAISVDGDAAEVVQLDLTAAGGLDSGAKIASEMQTKIQALGGNKASVTVDYDTTASGKYAIVSPTLGTDSSVVITRTTGGDGCVTEELKIGTTDGGTETGGTGDVADASAATAAEIAAVINGDWTGSVADGSSGSIALTSSTTGSSSSIVIGAGTLNTVLGFTGSAEYYGYEGLGYGSDMDSADYWVSATLNGVAQAAIASDGLSINSKTASGFSVVCETAGSTHDVDIIVVGVTA